MTGLLSVALVAAGLAQGFVRVLDGPDGPAREAVIRELTAMGKRSLPQLSDATYRVGWRAREAILESLSRIGVDALPTLIAIARNHPKVDARRGAVVSLEGMRIPAVGDSLRSLLGGSEDDLVLRAIGSTGNPMFEDLLSGYLSDQRSGVRRRAVTAFGAVGGPPDRLIAMLSDSAPSVRFAAALALEKREPKKVCLAIDAAYEGLSSPGWFLALRTLGRLGCDEGVPTIRRGMSSEDWSIRAEAGAALAAVRGNEERPTLLRALGRETHPLAVKRLRREIELLSKREGG